jgi:hypothetical protein
VDQAHLDHRLAPLGELSIVMAPAPIGVELPKGACDDPAVEEHGNALDAVGAEDAAPGRPLRARGHAPIPTCPATRSLYLPLGSCSKPTSSSTRYNGCCFTSS